MAKVDYILCKLFGELEHGDVLVGEEEDLGLRDVEERHVAHIVEHLVEADMLVSQFFPFAPAVNSARLDVPDGDRLLFFLQLHPRLLEDAF